MHLTLATLLACAPSEPGGSAVADVSGSPSAEVCANDLDDDGDGAADCADTDCDGGCPEACGDGRDNDGDAAVDCDDVDCSDPACVEDCLDGRDNDDDGSVDCSDPDCSLDGCAELCADGRDNDGDDAVDCADTDCDGDCPETCDDARDNDGDGWIDCDDAQCTDQCAEGCADGLDDDADGLVDCADPECACDVDGDGFDDVDLGGDDCDDADASVFPGAGELCGGADEDCDGLWDDDDPDLDVSTLLRFHADADGDGFGDREAPTGWLCVAPPGTVADSTDCNDAVAEINPGAAEVCNGLDDDCDALVDDADPSVDLSSATDWYPDLDGDGFGAGLGVYACGPPNGHVANDDDCDDADPSLGAPGDFWFDEDGDGFGAGAGYGVVECVSPADGWVAMGLGEDCAPLDPGVYPRAPETCEDGIDQDCDGVDEGCCVAPKPDCDALLYEASCYLFCRDSKTWEDARDFCAGDGGHLLTLDDADEEIWADATVDVLDVMHGIVGSYWWMGFNDKAVEGVWQWEDATPVAYTNWYAGEPNNVGNEDCGQIDQFDPFLGWNDQACSAINRYICER